jgi:hypothetical protein
MEKRGRRKEKRKNKGRAKKMKKILFIIFIILFTSTVYGAGTISWDFDKIGPLGIYKYTATCTADSSDGSYPSTSGSTWNIDGFVLLVETDPGSTAPTDNYDIVLNDKYGADIMGGDLADRDSSATERVKRVEFVDGRITPVITNNSVNSAVIVIYIYVAK